MKRVTGIGGVFFKGRDAVALRRWVSEASWEGNRIELWEPPKGGL